MKTRVSAKAGASAAVSVFCRRRGRMYLSLVRGTSALALAVALAWLLTL